jgi:glutathione S-transferase
MEGFHHARGVRPFLCLARRRHQRGQQFEPAFLAISRNNRMPAIVDPDGPDGQPISVFESGAILQCLAGKTGRFGGDSPRERVAVSEWLFWQMGGLGPMAGQANHFRVYVTEKIPYAIDRYTDEVNRLFGVMNRRLADHEYLAGPYSIADMACVGWTGAGNAAGRRSPISRISRTGLTRCWRDLPSSAELRSTYRAASRATSRRTRRRARSCSASGRDRDRTEGRAIGGCASRAPWAARRRRSGPTVMAVGVSATPL